MFKAGLLPKIQEKPRYRKLTKRGYERLFNAAIHALRAHGEQTFVWEDEVKWLLYDRLYAWGLLF